MTGQVITTRPAEPGEEDTLPYLDVSGIDTLYVENRAPVFRRLVEFRKGWNELHDKSGSSHGQHGMEIAFTLKGPGLAVTLGMNTGWTPLGVVDEGITRENGFHRELVHCDTWRPGSGSFISDIKFGSCHPPSGSMISCCVLGSTPSEWYREHQCQHVGGTAWTSNNYSASDPLVYDLINKGEAAMWRGIAKHWREFAQDVKDGAFNDE